MATIEALRRKAQNIEGKREALAQTAARLENEIAATALERELIATSRELLGKAAERSREEIKGRIERMVSYALRSVLERDDYRFELVFADKRGRAEVEPILHTANSSGNPLDNNGGGVVDIITTTLRLIVKLTLGVPGPIIIDEPAKWISKSYQPNYMRMLKEFSVKTGTQIIMATHEGWYVSSADNVVEVRLADGESIVNGRPDNAH